MTRSSNRRTTGAEPHRGPGTIASRVSATLRRPRKTAAAAILPLATATVATPLGELLLRASPRGLREVRWPTAEIVERPTRWSLDLTASAEPDPRARRHLASAAAQLADYFAGTRTTFELALDPLGTPFQLATWEILRTIPFGATISYADQARRLGDPRKARAVGSANGKNPLPIVVPCHRVIGSGGGLVGFAAGTAAKAWLLEHERDVAPRAPAMPASR